MLRHRIKLFFSRVNTLAFLNKKAHVLFLHILFLFSFPSVVFQQAIVANQVRLEYNLSALSSKEKLSALEGNTFIYRSSILGDEDDNDDNDNIKFNVLLLRGYNTVVSNLKNIIKKEFILTSNVSLTSRNKSPPKKLNQLK